MLRGTVYAIVERPTDDGVDAAIVMRYVVSVPAFDEASFKHAAALWLVDKVPPGVTFEFGPIGEPWTAGRF